MSGFGRDITNLRSNLDANAAALVNHCSQSQNKNERWCNLRDGTQLGDFGSEEQTALAQFCFDIIPEGT